MNLACLVHEAAQLWPTAPAVISGSRCVLTYAGLSERVARLAGYLRAQGAAIDSLVVVFMTNHPSYLESLHAILHVGAVAVPVNAKLHEHELAHILEETDAAFVFVNSDTESTAALALTKVRSNVRLISVDSRGYFESLRADPIPLVSLDSNALAWLFYTSGTTGRSKGAMLTHRNLFLMACSYLTEIESITSTDSILHAAPMSHGSGLYSFVHTARGAAHIIPESRGFDTLEVAEILQTSRGVSIFAAPTMVHRLVTDLPADDPVAGLKTLIYGGGPMLVEPLLKALRSFGPRLTQIYGQGECPMTITRLPALLHHVLPGESESTHRRRLSSVGVPFHLVDVLIGSSTNPQQSGEEGEILVRSPIVMKGYWRKPAATSDAIENGWLKTGDVGYRDDSGLLYLSDRSKDVIISGGSNIYSREIEDILIEHPAVFEVAIIGRQHAEWGEEVVAVIGHGDHEHPPISELEALCLSRVARFKRPRDYIFVPELPKNAYGKIDKRLLRERYSAMCVDGLFRPGWKDQ